MLQVSPYNEIFANYLIVVIPTAVGYMVMSFALSHLNASVVSLYQTLQPIDTAIISYILLGEKITAYQCIGGLGVILGLTIVVFAKSRDDT